MVRCIVITRVLERGEGSWSRELVQIPMGGRLGFAEAYVIFFFGGGEGGACVTISPGPLVNRARRAYCEPRARNQSFDLQNHPGYGSASRNLNVRSLVLILDLSDAAQA